MAWLLLVAFALAPSAWGISILPPNVSAENVSVSGEDMSLSNTEESSLYSEAIHPWPCKNGNFLRTGQGRLSGAGPRDIRSPSWVFETELPLGLDAFYQSPVIDINHNAIFSSTTGRLFSMDRNGVLNWAVQLRRLIQEGGQPPTPVLLGSSVYAVDGQGFILQLSLATGHINWQRRYSWGSGQDSWSIGLDLDSGTLFVVGYKTKEDIKKCGYGGTHFYALSINRGETKWSYEMGDCNCNIMPSVHKGAVIFSDHTGTVYSLDIATGEPLWKKPGNGPNTFTTGTAAVGENGLVYVTSNFAASQGILRVYNVTNGEVQWQHPFDREANNAPAVFKDHTGRTLVAVGVSNNGGVPAKSAAEDAKGAFRGTLYALDAKTGTEVWTWEPPIWRHQACANSTWERLCLPDAFSNPSVDTNSTIFIGWMGGDVYAIDGTNGQELSKYHIGSGIQGAPGIADGMLVASSCLRMAGFSTAKTPL